MTKIRGLRSIVLILAVAILAWMVMDFNSRMASLNRVSKVQKNVIVEYQEIKATKAVLETEVAFAASDAAVEKWAYEDGHMVRPGDHPIKPLAGAVVTPTPAPKPAVIQHQMTNTESWLALFLGQ